MSKLKDKKPDSESIDTETAVAVDDNNKKPIPDDLTNVELKPFGLDEKSYDTIVEEERLNIHKMNKSAETRSRICILIIVAFGVCGVIFLYQPSLRFISWISLGIALAAIVVFSVWNKRIGRPDPRKYIYTSCIALDRFIFDHPDVKDARTNQKRKFELNEVAENGIFSNVNGVTSRNFVEGLYKNHHFLVAEAAFIKSETKTKRKTLYIGKYLSMKNDLHFEGRYVISILNEKEIDKPNGIGDLELLNTKENMRIYGAKDSKYKNDIPLQFIEKLSKMQLNDQLLAINVVVRAGETILLASYDDDVISLPFYKPLNVPATERFKKELYLFMDACSLLIKD